MQNKLLLMILFVFCSSIAFGQVNSSISFENTTQRYFKDTKTKTDKPLDIYGSNSYLDSKFSYNRFTVGVRFESYLPALQGYSKNLNTSDITNKYISFSLNKLSITAGNFYEQFGSGLIFRSFEERQLGLDNSLYGGKVIYNFNEDISFKIIQGQQRHAFELSGGKIRGIDGTIYLSKIDLPIIRNTSIGASYINKYQEYTGAKDFDGNVESYSARLDYNNEYFSLYSEYVSKGLDEISDDLKKGNSLYLTSSLYLGDFSINGIYRRVKNMESRSERKAIENACMVNYIPSLTKQHKYSLCNRYVYGANLNDEEAYQLDMYYSYNDYQVSANYSLARKPSVDKKLFTSTSVELFKEWEFFKMNLVYNTIMYNQKEIEGNGLNDIRATIMVADLTYKVSDKLFIRSEFQHLWEELDTKNWASVKTEVSFAPTWTIFIGDDYNYGNDDKNHYYNGGFSYTKNSTSFLLSYALTRGGLNCVGGICRYLPQTKALTINLITKF